MASKVFVHDIGPATTASRLTAAFTHVGLVLSARVMTAPGRPRDRRFGLVTMRDADTARRAVTELDGQELDGRVMTVRLARGAAGSAHPLRGARGTGRGAGRMAPPDVPVLVSFLVGARAFRYLVDHLRTLGPRSMNAVEGAQQRGCVVGSYYFLDAPDAIVREVRNCLRRGAGATGLGGEACAAAASAVENRRRAAWASADCPRCGGRFRPRSWLVPNALMLVCQDCCWSMPA